MKYLHTKERQASFNYICILLTNSLECFPKQIIFNGCDLALPTTKAQHKLGDHLKMASSLCSVFRHPTHTTTHIQATHRYSLKICKTNWLAMNKMSIEWCLRHHLELTFRSFIRSNLNCRLT